MTSFVKKMSLANQLMKVEGDFHTHLKGNYQMLKQKNKHRNGEAKS